MGLTRSKNDLWYKGKYYHTHDSEWDDLPSREEKYLSVINVNPVVSRQYENCEED